MLTGALIDLPIHDTIQKGTNTNERLLCVGSSLWPSIDAACSKDERRRIRLNKLLRMLGTEDEFLDKVVRSEVEFSFSWLRIGWWWRTRCCVRPA